MTVDELPDYLRHHWLKIRTQLETGIYRPQPVKRVEIPKGDGKDSLRMKWATAFVVVVPEVGLKDFGFARRASR